MQYKIFLEGDYDNAFIKAYLNHIYLNKINNIELIPTNGWTFLTYNANSFRDNTDQGGTNIVIFDADFVYNNGGFDKRYDAINKIKREQSIEFELFLFPNNSDDGDLETLLSRIICQQHRPIIECFNSYETCLQSQANQNSGIKYNMPLTKTKIYAYMETLLSGKILKVAKDNNHWFFESQDYWDLNSVYLNPLNHFFMQHIL